MSEETKNTNINKVDEFGIGEKSALEIKSAFNSFLDQTSEWEARAKELVITDESQTDLMKQAREARLALRNIRVSADKKRKELKEHSIRYGKAVQGAYNIIDFKIRPIEEHLEAQEKFIENKRLERIQAIRDAREEEVQHLREFIPYGIDLGTMSDDDYTKLLSGAILQQKAKEDAERKAEEERIERERKEAEERKRLAEENERLRKEAQERERLAEIERKKQKEAEEKRLAEEAKLRAIEQEKERKRLEAEKAERDRLKAIADKEAQERERLQRELEERKAQEARKQAEEDARKERERLAAIELSKAPIKERMTKWVESFEIPSMPENNEASQNVVAKFNAFKEWALKEVSKF